MNVNELKLYSYWRSSAAYRVRIALNLKELEYDLMPVHLIKDGGQQHSKQYHALNPQELIPTLVHGQRILSQSLAIIEYLDETFTDVPLLPALPRDRARVRALAQTIACDVHPLGNLRVMNYLGEHFGADQDAKDQWMRHWMSAGFAALEESLTENTARGLFCEGDRPGLADCLLVPQMYNARRYKLELKNYPILLEIEKHCLDLDAFDQARPENQPDANS